MGSWGVFKRASSLKVFTMGLLLALYRLFQPALLLKFLKCLAPVGTTLLLDSTQLRKQYLEPLKNQKESISKGKGKKGASGVIDMKTFGKDFFERRTFFPCSASF